MRTLVIAGIVLGCGGNPKPAAAPPVPVASIDVKPPIATGSGSDPAGSGSGAAAGSGSDVADRVALGGGGDPCEGGQIAGQSGVAGEGGLGLRGSGVGGAGIGGGPGIGSIGPRGSGNGGYGAGARLGRNAVQPAVRMGELTVMGRLDPTLVKRVLAGHMGQVRYCYERELQVNPHLAGKSVAKFVIDREGTVVSATAQGFDGRVESCIVGALHRLQFPKPAGGIVTVTVPLVFAIAQ